MKHNLSLSLSLTLTFLTSAALGLSVPSEVRAEPRVAVHDFYGPHGARWRDQVASLLFKQAGLTVTSEAEVEQLSRTLHVDPYSPEGRIAISRERGVSAWLTGVIDRVGKRARLTIIIYDGAEHQQMGRAVVTARNFKQLHRAVKHSLWPKAKYAILESLPPLPAGRAPIEEKLARSDAQDKPDAASPASDQALDERSDAASGPVETSRAAPTYAAYMKPPGGVRVVSAGHEEHNDAAASRPLRAQLADPLRFSLGLGSPRRTLRYSDALSDGLNEQQLGGAVMLDAALAYYPAQHFTDRWPSWIGLDLAAQGAIGSRSSDSFGNAYKSHYDAYRAGVRGRAPLGAHYVSLFTGYAIARTSMSAEQSGSPALTPAVDYRALRTGLGVELALAEGVALGVDAAWLSMLSAGELGKWFPRATASGLELLLSATYALSNHTFLRVSGGYRRTVFDFHAQPGDVRVAGGATDRVLTLSAGAGVSL